MEHLHGTEQQLEKPVEDNIENETGSNVFDNIEGLTLEIGESFFSKLNAALLNNDRAICKIIEAESNICDIAAEYGLLPIVTDAGAEAVVNTEKGNCVRNLYKSINNQKVLLRMLNKMQTTKTANPSYDVAPRQSEYFNCVSNEASDDSVSEIANEISNVKLNDSSEVDNSILQIDLSRSYSFSSVFEKDVAPIQTLTNENSQTNMNSSDSSKLTKETSDNSASQITNEIGNSKLHDSSEVDNSILQIDLSRDYSFSSVFEKDVAPIQTHSAVIDVHQPSCSKILDKPKTDQLCKINRCKRVRKLSSSSDSTSQNNTLRPLRNPTLSESSSSSEESNFVEIKNRNRKKWWLDLPPVDKNLCHHRRRNYTREEDLLMLAYLIKYDKIDVGKSMAVWDEFHDAGYLPCRTATSLYDHYRRTLLTKIRTFDLPTKTENKFINSMY